MIHTLAFWMIAWSLTKITATYIKLITIMGGLSWSWEMDSPNPNPALPFRHRRDPNDQSELINKFRFLSTAGADDEHFCICVNHYSEWHSGYRCHLGRRRMSRTGRPPRLRGLQWDSSGLLQQHQHDHIGSACSGFGDLGKVLLPKPSRPTIGGCGERRPGKEWRVGVRPCEICFIFFLPPNG